MKTFKLYRVDEQKKRADQPDFEGVEFSNKRVAVQAMDAKQVESWDSVQDMLAVRGTGCGVVWDEEK